MLDEYSRRCLAIRVERQIQSEHVLFTLWQAMTTYGIPRYIRSDNGSEFIAQKIQTWLKENQIKTRYIAPVALGRTVILKVFTFVFVTSV
mgnify:CR=1 FL=1